MNLAVKIDRTETEEIRPQKGPQEKFLSSKADIAIYGGAAGGGKSYALLMDPLRYIYSVRGFGCVIFRRTSPQITNEGALWDTSENLYGRIGAIPRVSSKDWRFPPYNNTVSFSHLELESNLLDYQGAQIPCIGFDELTHFTKKQFFYMLSRNRSMSGIKGYLRATCNPDPDSWVAEFISWWIDQETGFPIKERAGKIRYMYRDGDDIVWGNSVDELAKKYPKLDPEFDLKTVTFIPSSIFDNKKLLERDPSYLSNLNALPLVERMQLRDGNWKIRAAQGTVFKREWFEIVDTAPANAKRVRHWDRAATEPNPENEDPDWTAGVKVSRDVNGIFYIEHVTRLRKTPAKVVEAIKNTATQDGVSTYVGLWQDPAQAGKFEVSYYTRALAGFIVRVVPQTKNKLAYALPLSAQCEAGNVKIVRGDWNDDFLNEIESFSGDGKTHDDQVDGATGAFNILIGNHPVTNLDDELVTELSSHRDFDAFLSSDTANEFGI